MKKILILTFFSFFRRKKEAICTVNQNNAGKEIYDLDEATCFIALKLNKKKADLDLIRSALLAEMNYLDKTKSHSNDSNLDSELDVNQMIEYAINEEKVRLTKNELLEIYNTEIEYLMFIGVVE